MPVSNTMTSIRSFYAKLHPWNSTGLRGVTLAGSSILKRRYCSLTTKRTCLYDYHSTVGAKFESFAGYSMPIVYNGQTITFEHIQTRTKASVFDVSHMMQTIIEGADREKFMEYISTADVKNLRENKSTLSVLPNKNGGIIDDCIISNCRNHLFIVSNAGNANKVWSWFNEIKSNERFSSLDVHIRRLDNQGLIALQGPRASKVLQSHVYENLFNLEFMMTVSTQIDGVGNCRLTRCGYTGEDGFEISVEPENALALMELLTNNVDVKPAGLGARDTLRLEAGLCLHGNDISEETTPVEAGLGWTIHGGRRQNSEFVGSETILKQLVADSRPKRKRTGLIALTLGSPARHGARVINNDDEDIGVVTSGTYAPSLERNIAMAYLPWELATKYGHKVMCQVRNKRYEYRVTKMPFIPTMYYIKRKT